jgi:hypothetical protein
VNPYLQDWVSHVATITAHQWLNIVVAVAGALVAFGAANRMSRATECTIIFAFTTVGIGFSAWFLGILFPVDWEHAFDTLLLGGVVALLIGTRRQTIWLQPAWMPRISLAVSAVTWLAFFATV